MATRVFSHVALSCKDPAALERFYTRYLGFRRARVIPIDDGQIVFIKSGNAYLEIFPAQGEAPMPPAQADGAPYPGFRHLAFQVDDIDAVLTDMGDDAEITLGPADFGETIPGWRTVWVRDPEGNIVEISQGYVDQENPPPFEGCVSAAAHGDTVGGGIAP